MDRSRYDNGASRSDLAVEEVRYFKLEDSKYMAVPLSEVKNHQYRIRRVSADLVW